LKLATLGIVFLKQSHDRAFEIVKLTATKLHDNLEVHIVIVVPQHVSDPGNIRPGNRRMLGFPGIRNTSRSL